MKRMKRLLALALSAAVLCSLSVSAGAVEAGAACACVMDCETGRVLYEKDSDEQRPIASITKIMTGYLACENSSEEELDTEIKVSAHAAAQDGSSFYLSKGETITLRTAIYGAMLPSGNDAAMVLAEHVGGSEEDFVAMMNEKAQELGMKDSLFGNPNGLVDEGNYSTAHDMCLLGRAAMENSFFAQVVRTRKYTSDTGKEAYGHIRIMDQDERCIGIKTGWTTAAGKTLVSCFQDPDTGRRLIICTLDDWEQFEDHIRLADYGFERFPMRTLCEEGATLSTLTDPATGTCYALNAAESLRYPLSKGDTRNIRVRITLPDRCEELQNCDHAGVADFYLKGKKLGSVPLLCAAPESAPSESAQ